MTRLTRRAAALTTLLAAGLSIAGSKVQAADFPAKAITIVVPFPAGGTADVLARTLGGKMADSLKVPVIVDNRPGGGAQIAVNAVKQAPADGYMIFLGDIGAFSLNPSLYPKLSYDPSKDLTPLVRLTLAPMMLIVPASSPYKTAADLVNASKSKSDGVNIASQGNGTGGHLFAEMLAKRTQGKLNHVPYRGSAPALQDLLGGQVDVFFDPIVTSGPYVKDGKLRALAVGSAQRSPQFPQVPTMQEVGLADVNLVPWHGMAVKAGTPDAIVKRLNDEARKALQSAEVSKRLVDMGLEIAPLSGGEFGAFMQAEAVRWGKVIQDAGIKLD